MVASEKTGKERTAPPSSNRVCMKYRPALKRLRDVADTELETGYFKFLWQGYDSVQECFNVRLNADFVEQLEKKSAEAKEARQPVTLPFHLGKIEFQVCDYAAKGFRYLVQNDDFIFMISNPENEWSVSVRYLSAGLCEWGIDVLRASVRNILSYISQPVGNDWQRLSRVDVAVDFYSDVLSGK